MKKNKASRFTQNKDSDTTGKFVLAVVYGVISSLVLNVILLFSASALILGTKDPDSLTLPASIIICVLSLMFGGAISAAIAGKSGVCAALAQGTAVTALAFSLHLICAGDGSSRLPSLFFLLYPIISMLGGFIGVKREKKPKTRFKTRF